MSIVARAFKVTICVAALATLLIASAGCGKTDDADTTPQWETVVSTDVSGAKPVKKLLGTYHLGDRVRLSWDLSGAENPSAMFTLRVVEITRGTGFGASVSTRDANFALHSDEVLVLGPLRPGDYRLYFSQRFPASGGPGYDVKLTISTTK
jgi:hypothetical protein